MHLLQVGVGSGGMVVLDLLFRESVVSRVTLIEPDRYKSHNVVRHYFPVSAVGQAKIDLAARWIQERRPEVKVDCIPGDLLDPALQATIESAVQTCDLGICAVDNEPTKYHFDHLMRRFQKPWTLGEVLSGGIGGWAHRFVPGGPCYGCVASHLQRAIVTDRSPAPDYSHPQGAVPETTIPARKAAIETIAGMHALLSLKMIENPSCDPGFSSLLWTLEQVEEVFPEAFRPYRFRIAKSPTCLICGPTGTETPTGEALDVALAEAMARLGNE